MVKNEVLIYAEIPEGEVVPGQHLKKETQEIDIDSVKLNGGFLVDVKALSLDPYLKGRMRKAESKSYSPPLDTGKPLVTLGVGEVIRSESDKVPVGSLWRGLIDAAEYAIVSGVGLHMGKVIKNDEQLPWTNLVGAVGKSNSSLSLFCIDVDSLDFF